jgi:hypothetical protein
MSQTIRSAGLALSCILVAGCEQTNTAPQSATRVTAPPNAIRAEAATGVWNREQVETYLKQDLKLTSVNLTPAGGDNYTGTGTTADGRTLQLNVKQVPGGIACTFEDDRGGSGRIAFGNPVPE